MQDAFSRFSILKYMGVKAGRQAENEASKATANAVLNGWIAVFGAPNVIFCDPDSRFCGHVFMRFLKENKNDYRIRRIHHSVMKTI